MPRKNPDDYGSDFLNSLLGDDDGDSGEDSGEGPKRRVTDAEVDDALLRLVQDGRGHEPRTADVDVPTARKLKRAKALAEAGALYLAEERARGGFTKWKAYADEATAVAVNERQRGLRDARSERVSRMQQDIIEREGGAPSWMTGGLVPRKNPLDLASAAHIATLVGTGLMVEDRLSGRARGTRKNPIEQYHASARRGFRPLISAWSRRFDPLLFFGVELEVEVAPTSARNADQHGSAIEATLGSLLAGLEYDASVPRGFEIVTQPAGLDTHRSTWLGADLRGLRSHDAPTCGLHIHFSRASFSEYTIYKLGSFLYSKANRSFIETFCRRSFNRYARLVPNRSLRGVDRYEALNITNERTVEFRLPRGTTKVTTIIATIEFLYASLMFASARGPRALTTEGFMRFIQSQDMLADTEYLRAYLQERRLAIIAGAERRRRNPSRSPTQRVMDAAILRGDAIGPPGPFVRAKKPAKLSSFYHPDEPDEDATEAVDEAEAEEG